MGCFADAAKVALLAHAARITKVQVGSKPLFAAHRTNVSYADKTDLRFFTFADAALYRNCGDHFAATPPKSRKRSLPSGFEDLFQTELSLLVA